MAACVISATASSEPLRSEVVSSFSWVGSASAMRSRMAAGLSGFGAIFADCSQHNVSNSGVVMMVDMNDGSCEETATKRLIGRSLNRVAMEKH